MIRIAISALFLSQHALAVEVFHIPTVDLFHSLSDQLSNKALKKSMVESQRKQYCISLERKSSFLEKLGKTQESNFEKMKPGTWVHYLVSTEAAGRTKYLGHEKWKVINVSADKQEATALVSDTEGGTRQVTFRRGDLSHRGVRPDPDKPSTCLLQDTLVGKTREGELALMGRTWKTLEYFRSPLGSTEQEIRVADDIPLGFLTVRELKAEQAVVREVDSFHW